jgi:hypothetical protein
MSLKTENSRRVAKSRPVCMGLNGRFHNAFISVTGFSFPRNIRLSDFNFTFNSRM